MKYYQIKMQEPQEPNSFIDRSGRHVTVLYDGTRDDISQHKLNMLLEELSKLDAYLKTGSRTYTTEGQPDFQKMFIPDIVQEHNKDRFINQVKDLVKTTDRGYTHHISQYVGLIEKAEKEFHNGFKVACQRILESAHGELQEVKNGLQDLLNSLNETIPLVIEELEEYDPLTVLQEQTRQNMKEQEQEEEEIDVPF